FQSGDTLTINGATNGSIISGGSTIQFNYNSATHIMSLSGADSVADYQAALRLIAFSNATNNDPTAGGAANARSISWLLNDGASTSAAVSTTINVTSVNDAPTTSNHTVTT